MRVRQTPPGSYYAVSPDDLFGGSEHPVLRTVLRDSISSESGIAAGKYRSLSFHLPYLHAKANRVLLSPPGNPDGDVLESEHGIVVLVPERMARYLRKTGMVKEGGIAVEVSERGEIRRTGRGWDVAGVELGMIRLGLEDA